MSRDRRTKVAIIGGGCAAVAAAFELSRPEHRDRYEVTIYQQGWRLGGKGASGRGPGGRIEEHGLHIWMGWYENAFRLMRECYAELDRDPATCPRADWRDASGPDSLVGVTDRSGHSGWEPWIEALPPNDVLPGEPGPARRFTVEGYMKQSASLVRTLVRGLAGGGPQGPATDLRHDTLVRALGRLLRSGELATLAGLSQGA